MNDEEKGNVDKLEFYFQEKMIVHLILKKKTKEGKNFYLNGLIVKKISKRLWIIKDRELGEVRVSISEIAPWGVNEFTEVGK